MPFGINTRASHVSHLHLNLILIAKNTTFVPSLWCGTCPQCAESTTTCDGVYRSKKRALTIKYELWWAKVLCFQWKNSTMSKTLWNFWKWAPIRCFSWWWDVWYFVSTGILLRIHVPSFLSLLPFCWAFVQWLKTATGASWMWTVSLCCTFALF